MVDQLMYRDRSRAYMEKAREHLREGDLCQASEKGWGAAALIVKAVAETRQGWNHQTHRQLYRVVGQLIEETGDEELGDLFAAANELHVNFYEDWLAQDRVTRVVEQAARFVGKVEALLDGQP